MSKRPLELLIEDIWESIEKIERYTEGMTQDNFVSDEKTTDAVVRNLEIIGEAAGRLPEDFTDQHSKIEWVKIIGLRNRIVHEYFGVDLQIIWQILKKDLPVFKKYLKTIRSELKD
ncbi:MAG: DUF86 domain-containing protein [Deltaproteobacteria bacterium]|nr:DUF86 domain-containing protein [Deltaproteobacteria bacterium]